MSAVADRRQVPGLKVTLYLDEEERFEGRPLWEAVLEWAHECGIRTALVTRGKAGFGRRRLMHTADIEALMFPLPLTVECVDEPARVEALLRHLDRVPTGPVVDVQRTSLAVTG
jgi:PII-like signaling protein